MKKNDVVTVEVTDIGIGGEGIGKVDGYTLFIKDAVSEETGTCRGSSTESRRQHRCPHGDSDRDLCSGQRQERMAWIQQAF